MFTNEQLKQLRQLMREEMEGAIEEKVRPLVREEVHASASLIREDMKAGNKKVVEEITEVITNVLGEASEKDEELEKRVERLEEHTGLAKQN